MRVEGAATDAGDPHDVADGDAVGAAGEDGGDRVEDRRPRALGSWISGDAQHRSRTLDARRRSCTAGRVRLGRNGPTDGGLLGTEGGNS